MQVISIYPTINFALTNSESAFMPYTYFGIGWFWYSTDNGLINIGNRTYQLKGETKSQLVLLLGLGAEYKLNNLFKVFMETDYRYGSIDNDRLEFIPIKIGVSLIL